MTNLQSEDVALKAALGMVISSTQGSVTPALRASFAAFLDHLYSDVSPADVLSEPAQRLAWRAGGLWHWGEKRKTGDVHLRVSNPPLLGGRWHDEVTFIDIVTDDMPFLVDSVSIELARLSLPVRMMLHPVYSVQRGDDGALLNLKSERDEGFARESWMHISIERQSAETLESIETFLRKILGNVGIAVADWRDMRGSLRAAVSAMSSELPPGLSPEVALEGQNFLNWLDDDHFVFLGFRHYRLSSDGTRLDVQPDTARGLLRDSDLIVLRGISRFDHLAEPVRDFIKSPEIIFINKSRTRSTVHRAALYDIIGIKQFNAKGEFVGLRTFIGLFTSMAYSRTAQEIPWLRLKVGQVIANSGIDPRSHSGKSLLHILNTYPRDDLFQISVDELLSISHDILLLAERQRTALFVWPDPFRRFVSCLVYTSRDHFDTALRQRFIAVLEKAYGGQVSDFATVFFMDSPLVRLQVTIDLEDRTHALPDHREVEPALIEAARGWDDRFDNEVMAQFGDEQGTLLRNRYSGAFPVIYRESVSPVQAARDLTSLEAVQQKFPLCLDLVEALGQPQQIHLRLFHCDEPIALSDVLPRLENMGLRIISEVPYAITPRNGSPVWLSELLAESRDKSPINLPAIRENFTQAFYKLWEGALEDDRYNRLTLTLGLNWREVSVLRAYGRYLQQARFNHSPSFVRDTLTAHTGFAQKFIALFDAKFNPAGNRAAIADLEAEIKAALNSVVSLAEDEVLRRVFNLLDSTLRTNFYQTTPEGAPKPYISFKLDSQKVTDLPLPRPLVEIWVYSPRVEGIHLRSGRVARGGLRWSDRRDDFRTEVLALMKAQTAKNAVIVPTGSKGGFYCKQLPTDKAAEGKEVIACYQTFIRGLLDLTDNRVGDGIVPPPQVVRLDGDDPYLVVAADKGTAKFSDIANAISIEYGFWLGDGFASGGSAGYDHKKMGITARGAWEAVKRHFREMGVDIQTKPFTCLGVGDMAGDVFGNGLLRSKCTLMVAAFNHKHIFLDPNPDAAVSFDERQRLFDLPGSQWSDYDAAKISKGGGVFERSAKSITLSDEVRARFGIVEDKLPPSELVRRLLTSQVDLIYLGGIGTFIKSASESQAEANDKSNDALRVDAQDVRAKVIGEGANLGITPRARIALAQKGIRLNADAIDNSAGVDTSDHEVNIKIALQPEMAKLTLTKAASDALLASMTDEVAGLVLRDNYLQPQLITLEQMHASELLDSHARLISTLEKAGRLDRVVDFMPSEEEIAQRATTGQGLTRPELATLLAQAKIALVDELVRSTLPDDPATEADLLSYFPKAMQEKHLPAIKSHRLRREIVATVLANEAINRLGITFVHAMAERSGYAQAEVVRAWLIVRRAYDLPGFWAQVEALDNRVSSAAQMQLLQASMRLAMRVISALLAHQPHPLDITAQTEMLTPALFGLAQKLDHVLPDDLKKVLQEQTFAFTSQGVPLPLALRVAQWGPLGSAPDIMVAAVRAKADVLATAQAYFGAGSRCGLKILRDMARAYLARNYWQQQMAQGIIDDLYGDQLHLAVRILAMGGSVEAWAKHHSEALARNHAMLSEVKAAPTPDLAMLSLASRSLKSLAEL